MSDRSRCGAVQIFKAAVFRAVLDWQGFGGRGSSARTMQHHVPRTGSGRILRRRCKCCRLGLHRGSRALDNLMSLPMCLFDTRTRRFKKFSRLAEQLAFGRMA